MATVIAIYGHNGLYIISRILLWISLLLYIILIFAIFSGIILSFRILVR